MNNPKMKPGQFHLEWYKKEYLRQNLTKEVRDLYYNTMLKNIKDLNKGKDIPCSWRGRLSIVKMATPPKLIYRDSVIPFRVLGDLHTLTS